MEWIITNWPDTPWYSWPFAIGATYAAFVGVKWMWKHLLLPGWQALKWVERQVEIHDTIQRSEPMLNQMLKQFPQNGGPTLTDQVIDNTRALQRLEDGQAEILNKFDTYIVQVKPGGLRSTDPK